MASYEGGMGEGASEGSSVGLKHISTNRLAFEVSSFWRFTCPVNCVGKAFFFYDFQ